MRKLLRTCDGTRLVADTPFGAGGQGEVWRAVDRGQAVAVKIYHPHTATPEQKEVLERLVAKGGDPSGR